MEYVQLGRMQQQGYSFQPTDEAWLVAGRSRQSVALARRGAQPDESYAIQANYFHLPALENATALAAHVRKGEVKGMDTARFALLQQEVMPVSLKDASCARALTIVEDRSPVRRTERTDPMLLESVSLACMHPEQPTLGLMLTYSHRHDQGNEDPHLAHRAKEMFDSLRFSNPE